MSKKQVSVRIEEELLIEAKERKLNRTAVFERALAEELGYKIERGTRLVKINS